MPTPEFWFLLGLGMFFFLLLLPFALSDKWKKKE